MTAFGNAKLAGRCSVDAVDLPDQAGRKSAIGFIQ